MNQSPRLVNCMRLKVPGGAAGSLRSTRAGANRPARLARGDESSRAPTQHTHRNSCAHLPARVAVCPALPIFTALSAANVRRGPARGRHPQSLVAWLASRQHGVARDASALAARNRSQRHRPPCHGAAPPHLSGCLRGRTSADQPPRPVDGGGTGRRRRWRARAPIGCGALGILGQEAAPPTSFSVCRGGHGDVRFHCSPVPADEITEHNGIPVTTVARTLLDIAPTLSPTRLKSAIDIAENRHLGDAVALVDLVERYPRRAGTAAVRRILAEGRVGFDVPREELEVRFAEFVGRFGIPRPSTNGLIDAGGRSFEVDCAWPAAPLIVELDSREHHENSSAFENDRARDQALTGEGWRVMRVTWRQLHDDPQRLAATLNKAPGTLS